MENDIFKRFNLDSVWDKFWVDRTEFSPYPSILDVYTMPTTWENMVGYYQYTRDMPGISKENLKVEVSTEGRVYMSAQAGTRNYSIDMQLPADVDEDTLSARLVDGVLTLTVQKAPPKSKKKEIQVK